MNPGRRPENTGCSRPIRDDLLRAPLLALATALALPIVAAVAAGSGEAVCPLPDADVKRAVTQFAAMYQVFQDKRCVNCHGAVNPFAKGGGHAGGDINLDNILKGMQGDRGKLIETISQGLPPGQAPSSVAVADAVAAIKTYFSAEPPLTDPQAISELLKAGGLDGVYKTVCAECHTHRPVPWELATSPFAGQSAASLCESFQKRMDPSDFLGHVTNDSLRFIQTGFEGTRGLNPVGQAFYTSEKHRPYGVEPVQSIGQDAFIKAANEWVDALGSTFHKPASCGCSDTHYKLNVKLDYQFHNVQGKAEGDAAASQQFSADMNFNKTDTFSAEAEVPFKMAIQTGMGGAPPNMAGMPDMAGSPIKCTSELNSTDTWHIMGKVQSTQDKGRQMADTMKISAHITKLKRPTEVVCVAYGHIIRTPGAPGQVEENSTESYDMIIPAVVGGHEKFNFDTASGKMVVELGVMQR